MDRKLLSRFSRLLQLVFGLAVLYVVGRYIYSSWTQVSAVKFTLNLPLFFCGLCVLFLFYVLYAMTWQRILIWLSPGAESIRSVTLHRIFFTSLLTRYLPAGKAVNIGSRIELYKRAGGRRLIAAQSLVFDQVNLIAGALLLGWFSLLLASPDRLPEILHNFRLEFVIAGALLLAMLLIGIDRPLAWFFELTKLSQRFNLSFRLPAFQRFSLLARYLAINFLQGLSAYLLVASIFPSLLGIGQGTLLQISAYPVSRFIGQAAAVVPGGLGVREGVYAYLLEAYIPVQVAVLGAGIVRLVSVLMEVVFNLSLITIERRQLIGHPENSQ